MRMNRSKPGMIPATCPSNTCDASSMMSVCRGMLLGRLPCIRRKELIVPTKTRVLSTISPISSRCLPLDLKASVSMSVASPDSRSSGMLYCTSLSLRAFTLSSSFSTARFVKASRNTTSPALYSCSTVSASTREVLPVPGGPWISMKSCADSADEIALA